jgi:hypothetical protein
MTRILVVLGLLLAVAGCKSRGSSSQVQEYGAPRYEGYMFVGCRPSTGECYNSCPDHRFLVMTEESKFCPRFVNDGPYECHCVHESNDEGPRRPEY